MKKIYPGKIKKGDIACIVPIARSLDINEDNILSAKKFLENLGLKVIFSKNIYNFDNFGITSIKNRINDLHQAFSNPEVKIIFAAKGGFNSNQLLESLDFNLIKNNPKFFCGFSDITILQNSIFKKTGLVTYSGPDFLFFAKKNLDYSLNYFKKCLFENKSYSIYPLEGNFYPINYGHVKGEILGGNLCTLNLIQGTKFWPNLKNKILFLEDVDLLGKITILEFDRNLESLLHQKNSKFIKGIVIGKFPLKSNLNLKDLYKLIKSKSKLNNIPVVAEVDFGHIENIVTFPIGGVVEININKNNSSIKIINH